MNLKRLWQRLVAPRKSGKIAPAPVQFQLVKHYGLEFANIENTPHYELTTTLSVGSETGDIVIEEPTLAATHASFTLQNDIVTVMAQAGETRIGDHVLSIGKAVILRPNDQIFLGDLQLYLRLTEEPVPLASEEEVPATKAPAPAEVMAPQESAEVQQRILDMRQRSKKTKAKPQAIVGAGRARAANMLPRFVGSLFDLMSVVIIWQVMSPFDDFRTALEILPQFLQEEVLPQVEALLSDLGVRADYEQFLKIFLDLIKEAENELYLSHLVSLLISWRLVTTLVTGVSLGSWMGGVRAEGNVIWKRLGGVLREMLAWVMLPSLINNLPTLFSRRSLQECLSFTKLFSPGKGVVMISWVLFFPLLSAGLVVAPLLRGLEIGLPIVIEEFSVRKSSKKKAALEAAGETLVSHSSPWLGARFSLAQAKWKLLPHFTWGQGQTGATLRPSLVFEYQDGLRIPLALHQNFAWPQLLAPVFSHNPIWQESFPTLWAYVQSAKFKTNSALQSTVSDSQQLVIQAELQELIKVAFSLSIENVVEHLQTYGPLLKGLLVFRENLQGLMGASADGSWMLGRFGSTGILIYQTQGLKPSERLIPLVYGPGRVFQVNYESSSERQKSAKILHNELWAKAAWSVGETDAINGASLVIEVIRQVAASGETTDGHLESIFGYFFEAAEQVLGSTPPKDSQALLASLKNVQAVLERLAKSKKTQPPAALALNKLSTKLTEIHTHLGMGDAAFFKSDAPSDTTSVPSAVAP